MRSKRGEQESSRRTFLKQMASAPVLFLPAPFQGAFLRPRQWQIPEARIAHFPFPDTRFVPHYPEKSPLDSILRFAEAGTDEYVTEGYAAQISALLAAWSQELKVSSHGISILRKSAAPSIQFTSLKPERETRIRSWNGIEVLRREFPCSSQTGIDRFLDEITNYLAGLKSVETADFEIFECRGTDSSPLAVSARIRYEIVGTRSDAARESRIGSL